MKPAALRITWLALLAAALAAGIALFVFFRAGDFSSSGGWLTEKGESSNCGLLSGSVPERMDRLLWEYQAGGPFLGGAAVLEDFVFAAEQSGKVHCLDRKTGQPRWAADLGGGAIVHATPLLVPERNMLFLGAENGIVYALNAEDGSQAWSFPARGPVNAGLRLWKDVIVAEDMAGTIFALRPETGLLEWEFAVPEGKGIHATPAVRDGVLYFATFSFNGQNAVVGALDLETRNLLWQTQVVDYVKGSPAADESHVYVATGGFLIYAFKRDNGEEAWRFHAENAVNSGVSVDSERVYAGSRDGNLYALDKNTGEAAWKFYINGWFESGLLLGGEQVYAGNSEASILIFNAQNGEQTGRFDAKNSIYATPSFYGGVFYVGDMKGNFYAVADGG